nr:ribonuclease III [Fulvivirga sedimenti]
MRRVRKLHNLFIIRSPEDKRLLRAVRNITGITPVQLDLYHLAVRHSSTARENNKGIRESNERLEYLGDAVLGTVIADYLFKKYPFKDEGFLTEIRSRLVNRESLNVLGRKVGIDEVLSFDSRHQGRFSHKSLYGDALEALIGAVYLDQGYRKSQKFILNKLILPYFDIEEVVRMNPNFKSTLIEWSQKENKVLEFRIIDVKHHGNHREFTACVYIDEEEYGTGFGFSKKKAEQDAALKTCELLKLI